MRKTKNIWVQIIVFVFVGWVIISIVLPNNTVFFGTGCSNPLVNQNVTVRDSIGATVNYQSLWEYEGDFIPFQGLQILNNAVIFSDGDCDRVVALELTTGNELWTANINGPKQIAIDDSRDVIYVYGLQNVQLIALNNSGDTLWINDSLRGQRTGITPYVLSDGRLFAFAGSLGFVSVDPTTGEFGTTVNLPDIGGLFRYISRENLWVIIDGSLEARELETSEVEWVSEYEGCQVPNL